MYGATAKEVVQDDIIVRDTLLIHSTPVIVLFDFGSTNTFITKTFVNRVGMSVEDLNYDLVVSTPTKAALPT